MNDTAESLLREARTLIMEGLVGITRPGELPIEPLDLVERITAFLADDYGTDRGVS